MKKTRWMFVTLLFVSGLCWVGCDDDDSDDNNNTNNRLSEQDRTMANEIAMANYSEIELGNMASVNANDSAVKAYAQRMVTEHTTALNDLKTRLQNFNNIDWPTSLNDEQDSISNELQMADSSRFDSVYMASQVMAHQETLQLMQDSMSIDNQALENYVQQNAPHVQEHLEQADSLLMVIQDEQNNDNDDNP